MRKQSILAAAFVAAAALNFGAYSATEDKAPATDAVAAAPQDAKPVMEVNGMDETMRQHKAAAASTAQPRKLTAAQDRSKHFHPRDGK